MLVMSMHAMSSASTTWSGKVDSSGRVIASGNRGEQAKPVVDRACRIGTRTVKSDSEVPWRVRRAEWGVGSAVGG